MTKVPGERPHALQLHHRIIKKMEITEGFTVYSKFADVLSWESSFCLLISAV